MAGSGAVESAFWRFAVTPSNVESIPNLNLYIERYTSRRVISTGFGSTLEDVFVARVSEVQIGSVFDRLTVAAISKSFGTHGRNVIVYCACGKVKLTRLTSLGQSTTSCGCFNIEQTSRKHTTHGMRKTSEWEAWHSMWQRCTNPNHKSYSFYQDKLPSEAWKNFENFLKDMGKKPEPSLTLERVDNSKAYGPENCVWATAAVQNKNRRNVSLYTDGVRQLSLPEISKILNVPLPTLRDRLFTQKLPIHKVLGEAWTLVKKDCA